MDRDRKLSRYGRVYDQLAELLVKTPDVQARMATVAALLYHKFDYFFWCGFYRLVAAELVVGPYQGPLACQVLAMNKGVCWEAIRRGAAVVVTDVREFPGHIACDSRSLSEIVVPVRDSNGAIVAVLDVDSSRLAQFDETDAGELERIAALISQALLA